MGSMQKAIITAFIYISNVFFLNFLTAVYVHVVHNDNGIVCVSSRGGLMMVLASGARGICSPRVLLGNCPIDGGGWLLLCHGEGEEGSGGGHSFAFSFSRTRPLSFFGTLSLSLSRFLSHYPPLDIFFLPKLSLANV